MKSPRRRWLDMLQVVCLAGVVAGCDATSDFLSTRSERGKWTAMAQPTTRLQPGDKVKINIYGEDRLTGDYEVDGAGNVNIPLVGAVRAVGATKSELEASVARKIRSEQILRDPVVTVDISNLRPFYVLGEVEKPGEYPFRSGLNARTAVALAGGYTYRANKSYVLVERAGESGFQEYPLDSTVPIYPGDLISIPERYF